MDYFRVLLQELVDSFFLDFTLGFSVDFVADQDEWEFLGFFGCSLIHELIDPWLDIIEWLG